MTGKKYDNYKKIILLFEFIRHIGAHTGKELTEHPYAHNIYQQYKKIPKSSRSDCEIELIKLGYLRNNKTMDAKGIVFLFSQVKINKI